MTILTEGPSPAVTPCSMLGERGFDLDQAWCDDRDDACFSPAYLMRQLGLAAYVDGIYYFAMLGAKKPEADFFTKVQACVGLSGEEILLIDDSRQNTLAAQQRRMARALLDAGRFS